MKQEEFCGTIALYWKLLTFTLTVFKKWRDFLGKAIFFPEINQFTCDKMFRTFAQMDAYPYNLYKFSFFYKQKYAYLKPNKSEK